MATRAAASGDRRAPLTRDRVLRAAVSLADRTGIDSVTMRSLGHELGVEAMSLYNHVANKEDVLAGMVDVVMKEITAAADEIDAPSRKADWKPVLRQRILAARRVMLRHRWAPALFETKATMTPTVLRYFDSVLGLLRQGGFSLDLAHHAMHALGGHALGYTPQTFVTGDGDLGPEVASLALQKMSAEYPNLAEMMSVVDHDESSTLGACDDQFEFEFGLDLILDGLERLRVRRPPWRAASAD